MGLLADYRQLRERHRDWQVASRCDGEDNVNRLLILSRPIQYGSLGVAPQRLVVRDRHELSIDEERSRVYTASRIQ